MSNVQAFLVNIWLIFIGLFLALYVILDGFDLGIGILSLFVREHERRGIMVASLSSIWDANETWLIVLGGALFGAFPLAYGLVLNAIYIPILTMILALIFRGVAFEFREHSHGRHLWDIAFGAGSLLAAVCQGFALGELISGPTVNAGRFAGSPFEWFSPFAAVVSAGVVFGYVLLGTTYLIIKTEGMHQDQSVRVAWVSAALMLAAAVVISIWTPLRYPLIRERWFAHGLLTGYAVPPAFAVLCVAMLARALHKRYEYAPFCWSVGIFLASLVGLGASLFPYIVPNSVTAYAAASDSMTLVFMMLGIGMLIPVMIAYNAYQYLVFRGKVTESTYGGSA